MYELRLVVEDMNGVIPIFLIDRGDFDEIYLTFKENNNTIITDNNGNIKESHFNYE